MMYDDRPNMKELIEAVREFLETKISLVVDKHTAFHTRVAVNVLKIVEREIELGPSLEAEENRRLSELLQSDGSVKELNKTLCNRLRDGKINMRDPKLLDHLKQTIMGRLSIDNPKYSAYQRALRKESL